jgi:hypothetical protein
VATAIKWVGAVTAVLTLIFGLHQLADLISANRARHHQVEVLLTTAKTQEQAGDREDAWTSLQQAAQVAKGDVRVETAQEDLAMRWLRTRRGPDEKRFDASKFLPVLERAASTTQGQRKADILAHTGCVQFLRSDDDAFEEQGRAYFREAFQIDAQNVYAHAMWGYWALWSMSGPRQADSELEEERRLALARKEFSMALASGRELDYVRQLQIDGLNAFSTTEGDVELMELADAMRKNHEPISPEIRHEMARFYTDRLTPSISYGDESPQPVVFYSEERKALLGALPPADQLATFTWLFDVNNSVFKTYWREYYRAVLQEAAGQHAEARQSLLKARSNMPRDYETNLLIEDAIRRLSSKERRY